MKIFFHGKQETNSLEFDTVNVFCNTFQSGMLYVALSRATSANGIYLMDSSKMDSKKFEVNKEVIDFYTQGEDYKFF